MLKKWCARLFVLLVMVCAVAAAHPAARAEADAAVQSTVVVSGTCGENMTWSLNSTGVLEISGSGKMEDYYSFGSTAPWKDHSSSICTVTVSDGVTSIGDYSFEGCGYLAAITLPDGLTSIGCSAFRDCDDLESITFPDGLTSIGFSAFQSCSGLKSITLPTGLTSIGHSAFYGCWRLTNITLPDGLTSIGYSAFGDCTSLTSISLPGGLNGIDNSTFSGCTGLTSITFRGDLASLGKSAFSNCSSLTSITFQNDFTSISESAFSNCTSLTEVVFLGRLGSIECSAFQDCTSLTSIALPNGLTRIESSAFQGCTGLTSISFPASLTSISDSAFRDCTGLASASFQDGLTRIGGCAFYGCTSLTSVTLPNSLTSIDYSAFNSCTGLTSVTFPDGLTSIGSSAFQSCTGLTSITLPSSLTELGTRAFARTKITVFISESNMYTVDKGGAVYDTSGSLKAYPAGNPQTVYAIQAGTKKIDWDMFYGAVHLTTVMVPESVASIGPGVFYGMTGLESVCFSGNSPSLNPETFERSEAKRLKIYHDVNATGWTEANWPSQYFELIEWDLHRAIGVALDAQTLTLEPGASQKLTATVLALAAPANTAVTWASADTDVAEVSADGTVLGRKAGTTTITATTVDGGFTASCTVTVKAVVTVSLGGSGQAALSACHPMTGQIYIVSYTSEGRMLGVSIQNAASTLDASPASGAACVKLLWLDAGHPVCAAQRVPL